MSNGHAVVYGLGVAGVALTRELIDRDWSVALVDDRDSEAARSLAAEIGVDLEVAPSNDRVAQLLADADMLCPAPGVPETHPVIEAATAAAVPIRTEIDLAYTWEQERAGGPRPFLAITGTDGKTTTTYMAAHLLNECGVRAVAVGNTEVPLVAALHESVDAFVVECSSFRLHFADSFRAEASAWLNFAPDHQNWHRSMASYEAAKARMWAHRRATDVAIGYAADPVVMRNLAAAGGVTRTFGASNADYMIDDQWLVGPQGRIAACSSLVRDLPHDRTNSLAASALVLEAGLAPVERLEAALRTFRHPPHRIEPLGEYRGARWFNDSKATSPHAALTAIRGFERVILLAGGRNKGLDLASLATEMSRIKAVIGLGEAAADVVAAFDGHRPTQMANSMAEAVEMAAAVATAGDTVLLSPACASFDWYPNGGYPARGDDFKQCFRAIAMKETS